LSRSISCRCRVSIRYLRSRVGRDSLGLHRWGRNGRRHFGPLDLPPHALGHVPAKGVLELAERRRVQARGLDALGAVPGRELPLALCGRGLRPLLGLRLPRERRLVLRLVLARGVVVPARLAGAGGAERGRIFLVGVPAIRVDGERR
jgi:hypothetical protein